MTPLVFKADLNKLWHDVQNERDFDLCQIGKDLFHISKVIDRKTKWPRLFGLPVLPSGQKYGLR